MPLTTTTRAPVAQWLKPLTGEWRIVGSMPFQTDKHGTSSMKLFSKTEMLYRESLSPVMSELKSIIASPYTRVIPAKLSIPSVVSRISVAKPVVKRRLPGAH